MSIVRLPFYHKTSAVLVGLIAACFIMYIGESIIVPIMFAWVLAILLNPMVNWLVKKRINRIVSISISVLSLFLVVSSILYFIGAQIASFSDALPELKIKFADLLAQTVDYVSQQFRIPQDRINIWIENLKSEGISQAGGRVGSTILSISNLLVLTFLVPVYIFLFLYYKPMFLHFIAKVFSDDKSDTVQEVLAGSKSLIQSYLLGLLVEMVIVAIMNSIALLIIGVPYAIVLGVIGAIMNLIPYIGGVVAIGIPMLLALVNASPFSAFLVLIAYLLIQLIDNNVLVPLVVASKVKVNAFVSIVVVLVGGAIWGVAGMFLAIPLTAILKVIFDNVPALEPFGFIIGDEMTTVEKLHAQREVTNVGEEENQTNDRKKSG